MLMLAACPASSPAVMWTVGILAAVDAIALVFTVVCLVVLRWSALRSARRDPYAEPFGDLPPHHLRAFLGPRR